MDMPAASTNHHENPKDAPSHVDQPSHHSASRLRPLAGHINYWDLFFLAMLILLAFKVNWGLHFMRDVRAPDEPFYLYSGLTFDVPHASMSPLYCGWYSLLSLVAPDPMDLYYLNWFLLPMALAIGVYLLARSLGSVPLIGFLTASAILLSRIPDIVPRPMHFAAALVLIGLATAMLFRSAAMRLAVATLSLGLASFARPELTLAFFGMAIILLAILLWEGWLRRTPVTCLIGMGVIAILPFCLLTQSIGLPIAGTRSSIAFSQHYSKTKFDAGLIDVKSRPDWTGPFHDYPKIVTEDFGKPVVSLSEAWEAAPEKVLGHVFHNAVAILPTSGKIIASTSDAVTWGLWGYLALLIVVGLVASIKRLRDISIHETFSRAALPTLMGLIAIAPLIAACLVIHPRDHYLVGLLTIAVAYATATVGGFSLPRCSHLSRAAVVAVATLVVIIAPNNCVQWKFNKLFAENPKPAERRWQANMIEFVRQVPFQGPLRIMDRGKNGVFMFTDFDFETVIPRSVQKIGFTTALEEMDLNVVLIPIKRPQFDKLRNDTGYLKFRRDPPPEWIILGEPHQYWWLAVRRDALGTESVDHLAAAPKVWIAVENQYAKQLR